jgi:hypothetical protein
MKHTVEVKRKERERAEKVVLPQKVVLGRICVLRAYIYLRAFMIILVGHLRNCGVFVILTYDDCSKYTDISADQINIVNKTSSFLPTDVLPQSTAYV